MSRSFKTVRVGLVAVCIILSAALAQAQYRASIQGVVTDPQGAVIPGATVTLTNLETNQVTTAKSNEAGIYNFGALPPSHFTIKVEMTGFKQKSIENVTIISEQANSFNVRL